MQTHHSNHRLYNVAIYDLVAIFFQKSRGISKPMPRLLLVLLHLNLTVGLEVGMLGTYLVPLNQWPPWFEFFLRISPVTIGYNRYTQLVHPKMSPAAQPGE